MPRRNILVVGATGKQGGATVRHLVAPNPDGAPAPARDVHVYALTRNPASPAAKKLVADVRRLYGDDAAARVELVEGDLTDAAGIRAIFEATGSATGEKGFWGVFVAQAFPGLGKKDDGERERGVVSFLLMERGNEWGLTWTDAGEFGARVQRGRVCVLDYAAADAEGR